MQPGYVVMTHNACFGMGVHKHAVLRVYLSTPTLYDANFIEVSQIDCAQCNVGGLQH